MTEAKELFLLSEVEEPAGRTRGFASMRNKQPAREKEREKNPRKTSTPTLKMNFLFSGSTCCVYVSLFLCVCWCNVAQEAQLNLCAAVDGQK